MTSQPLRKQIFSKVRKIVIKIGTNVLISRDGTLDMNVIDGICRQTHELNERGVRVIIVSSGAIGTGIKALGLKTRPTLLPELQAAAAVGQNRLMVTFDEFLSRYGRHAGQILLTRQDLEDRARFVNVGNTIRALLHMGAVPIINENDTVSVDEIKFGGNDVLASQVVHVLKADALIFLSTVDGLYDAAGNVIDVVQAVNEDVLRLDTGDKSSLGIGGMQTKLQSIQQVTEVGDPVAIINGKLENAVLKVLDGEQIGTVFCAGSCRLSSRKRWMRFSVKAKGKITVDDGAVQALVSKNKSLLASGITGVEGKFSQGDMVEVTAPDGRPIARGLTNYSSEELEKIKGAKTSQIAARLGYKYYDEVIHRDDLVTVG